jgi:hypothetical protein
MKPAMKIERDADGRLIVDAAGLAPLLGLAMEEFQRQMRAGQIATGTEEGQGEDAGRFRVTFTTQKWKLRLTCAADGSVLSQVRTELPAARTPSSRGQTAN